MKKLSKLALLLTVVTFLAHSTFAQVKFKITYEGEQQHWVVSILPEATYVAPNNITGTGQITIKVPSNRFEPVNIVNYQPTMVWEANSRSNSPEEAPEFDYISFGLINQGATAPDYTAGIETPLFSFQNEMGCTGAVYLVDHGTDPFMPPNSQKTNIGNSLAILGAAGDAYAGNIDGGFADCSDLLSAAEDVDKILVSQFNLYPNPCKANLTLEINWENKGEDVLMEIINTSGIIVYSQRLSLQKGLNVEAIELPEIPSGIYWLKLKGSGNRRSTERFFKI